MRKEMALGVTVGVIIFLAFLEINVLPFIVLAAIGIGIYIVTQTRGVSLGLGKTKRLTSQSNVPPTSFDDVGGHQRTKDELTEALDFLKRGNQIKKYGIRPLKGLLLSGPPGTGKTLMAKAAAHYTDSIFVSTSGSEFIEKYVGVGASRIRDLFHEAREQAKKQRKNSAIVFIDEIDVIGGKREGNQHREYDQTLNQLLTEMDGMHSAAGVQILVIAATNRPDLLDKALTRPGRFDRHIVVDLPDKAARRHILKLHLANKPLAKEVDIEQIAQETFGFSGAQLESVANEAAIYALRDDSRVIKQKHLTSAIDKVMMGEKSDRQATKEEQKRVAVHELGHAIISELVRPGSVSQVTLSPRGKALGYVRQNPMNDQFLYTKEDIESQIMVALAGAVAEEMMYGDRSTGSRNDFEQANRHTALLIESGLSDLGIINTELINKEKMQEESTRILEQLLLKTRKMLSEYKEVFTESLTVLLAEETISGDRFRTMIAAHQGDLIKTKRAKQNSFTTSCGTYAKINY